MSRFKLVGSYSDDNGNEIIVGDNTIIDNVEVILRAKNSTVIISPEVEILKNIRLDIAGENGVCIIGRITKKVNQFRGEIRLGHGSFISIGDDITCTKPLFLSTAEETKLLIGDDCMFSTGNQVRTDDSHAIYDVLTGVRLNKSKDVIIGAHTWLAFDAKVFGGSIIGDGSIIGLNSIVKGKFPNNCIVEGSPAKIVRYNTAWERPNILRKEPWVRSEVPQNEVTEKYWRLSQEGVLKPSLGEGFIKNLDLLAGYRPKSEWLTLIL